MGESPAIRETDIHDPHSGGGGGGGTSWRGRLWFRVRKPTRLLVELEGSLHTHEPKGDGRCYREGP
jgi:hypothetical protein